MAEIAFETLQIDLEDTAFAVKSAPSAVLSLAGTITPKTAHYKPSDADGTVAANRREKRVRGWGEWQASGAADTNDLYLLLQMAVDASPAVSNPTAGVDLAAFIPVMTGAAAITNTKTATLWADGYNTAGTGYFKAAGGILKQLTFTNDASSTNTAQLTVNGVCTTPSTSTSMSAATIAQGELLEPLTMQLWIDTSSAIGTTEITGQIVRAEHQLDSRIVEKFIPVAPASALQTINGRGIAKRVGLKTRVTLLALNTGQWTNLTNGTAVKVRVRHSGSIIASSYRYYAEFDTYGVLENLQWGAYEGANRTVSFEIQSRYDATLAADYRIAIERATP